MKKGFKLPSRVIIIYILLSLISCSEKNNSLSKQSFRDIDLKRGEMILCGPADQQFGNVAFEISCPDIVREHFVIALAMLHSFEYDEAEKIFAKVIDAAPDCAMGWWGIAMSNLHPLWAPPGEPELEKGARAIEIALSLDDKSKKETAYIDAMASFYLDWKTLDHTTRMGRYEKAMEKIHIDYPEDKEAAIFYALSLVGTANPSDTTFTKQKKAGTILTSLYPDDPDHPGIIHYIIHSYDSPPLATFGLEAARKYAAIAPSSAHAQHMPSHIFIRLGLWDESIQSNLASTSAAQCYAEETGMKGHWDEELHGLDYLMYAYLQKGDNKLAKEELDYVKTIHEVFPINFKEAYAFAAIPARFALENKSWHDAGNLETHPADFPWEKFPWQKAIIHFTRLLGAVHLDRMDAAKSELDKLTALHDTLASQKDSYKANQVMIQIKSSNAWILWKEGKNKEALALMEEAATMEDHTQKHPVTPGEVLPARELLGDMLMEMNKPDLALKAYEADLKTHPNRFNGLYGAGLAAEKANQPDKASTYYQQLVSIAKPTGTNRPEIDKAILFLEKRKTGI